jgi:phage terminase large subunit
MFETTSVYLANLNATENIVINQGGTYSSKTYSIIQVLFTKAVSNQNLIITVVGDTVNNIKRGALRDAIKIVQGSPILNSLIKSYNATDRTFHFYSGSIMEFMSFLDEGDARAGKRDILFINEANILPWDMVEQLINRSHQSFIDYNPSSEFWAHEKLIVPKMFGAKSVKLLISDHRHNGFLSPEQHEHIEKRYEEDHEWGRVYARGMTGKIEGLIFRNWERVFLFPEKSEILAYGLDFGFTNDPTSLTEIRMQNGELYIKLHIYETGLTNPDISNRMNELGIDRSKWIIADSAEPKSIQELYSMGWKVEGANKGPDSIKSSIDILKRYKMNIVGDSFQLVKELGAYKWKEDKVSGKPLNEPIDFMNHAIDSIRYVALNRLMENNSGEYYII